MSKILDMLKVENAAKIDPIQEQLAEIYIAPTKKKKESEQPRAKKPRKKTRLALFLIIGLAFAALAGLLFSSNKVSINVIISKEAAAKKEPQRPPDLERKTADTPHLKIIDLPSNTIGFDGSAAMESKLTEQYLYLVNGRGLGWATALIAFKKPVNLVKNLLTFSVKGERGNENLLVILKDKNKKTYQSIQVGGSGLSRDWKSVKIEPGNIADQIDLSAISEIRLEFGSATANNSASAAIYVKDIALINNTRGD